MWSDKETSEDLLGYTVHARLLKNVVTNEASMVDETDKTTYGNTFATLFKRKGSKLSEDFFAMLDFLKKSLTREDIKRELMIAGMGRFDDLDDYVDLVVRTRAELESMIRVENVVSINKYMGWI